MIDKIPPLARIPGQSPDDPRFARFRRQQKESAETPRPIPVEKEETPPAPSSQPEGVPKKEDGKIDKRV